MQTHDQKYHYEVHVAGYDKADLLHIPEPFFINQVTSTSEITSIVTAELQNFSEALSVFEQIQQWCDSQKNLHRYGCRITLEQVLKVVRIAKPLDVQPLLYEQSWKIDKSAFVTFFDVHADGIWNNSLSELLVKQRGYIPLKYITKKGKEFLVLTLHFLNTELAMHEANYLQHILEKGGFQGTLSVESTLAVAVIGPPITRPIVVEKLPI